MPRSALTTKIRTFGTLFSDRGKAKDFLIDTGRLALIRMGMHFYMTDRFYVGNEDRRILETQLLPWYSSRPEFKTIVFTGNQWYTMGYRKLFKNRRWIVMEQCPRAARRYGGPDVVNASCADAALHFPAESLDLVLFSGVFGYGLNTREELESALNGFYSAMKPGAEMLFSWDDTPKNTPFDPLTSPAFAKFERITCPLFHSDKIVTSDSWKKTWIFLRKPGDAPRA